MSRLPENFADLVDLGDDHSLTQDPTVARLRAAAELLDEDVWIAVRLPGDYEGADELDDGVAVQRSTGESTGSVGLGFAIPSSTVTQVVRELEAQAS